MDFRGDVMEWGALEWFYDGLMRAFIWRLDRVHSL